VGSVSIPGAVYRKVDASCVTTVDLGIKSGPVKMLAANFIAIAREHLGS
jgi:hypothetical protein